MTIKIYIPYDIYYLKDNLYKLCFRCYIQQLLALIPPSLSCRPPFSTQPTAHLWRCEPGVVAHAQSLGREVVCAGGGLGCWLVLPGAGVTVGI